jgi:predicted O-methyltransferase YrrM
MHIPFNTLPQSGFDLALIATQYRSSELSRFFTGLNERISMLHADVLALLYHFGAHSVDPVLELGPYMGGSTVAVARGLLDSGRGFKIISVEKGGKYDHPNYPTSDIVASLRANLAEHGVETRSHVIVGHSREHDTVLRVKQLSEAARFGCLIIDSDGQVEEDIRVYGPLLAPQAYLVIDDYYSPGAPEKQASTRHQLDDMTRKGVVEAFGVHGWGTWFGRFR